MPKKFSHYILFLVVGVVSIFATCKKSTDSDTVSDQTTIPALPDEEPEIDPGELEEPEAIPNKISLSPKSSYAFKRRTNPYKQSYFRNPFDSTIYVSGTFCELRGNHFHGGLDIRTGGQEGWPVLASANGYVERVKVSTSGYGRVIYVRHPNGYTTVYGHLKEFKGKLANYVKEAQYKQRTFEIELFPKANEIPFKKGQVIALSGNTGGSGGPHLHFEIRNPRGESTNPLLHGLNVDDNLKPVIKNISLYLKDAESLRSNGNYPYKLFKRDAPELKGYKAINVRPGTYSFGMRYDDYFTDRRNKLGVNYTWLTANGKLLYQYQIERFKFSDGRFIYTHTDPYLKYKTGLTFVRLFKEKFNPLPYYKQAQNGEVLVRNGDSIAMKLFIQDYAGLTDSITWIVVGDTAGYKFKDVPSLSSDKTVRIPREGKSFAYNNWHINVPRKAVYHPFDFRLKILPAKSNMLSETLQMHYPYTPLHSYSYVSYSVPPELMKFGNKLCAVSFTGGGSPYYEGGTLQGNKLSFKTRSLGEYAITKDDKPPTVTPLKVGKDFSFRVRDNLSGVKKIICSIDGKWILAEYEPKRNHVWGEIPAWIKPGTHEFKIIVIDGRSNRAEYKKSINL